VQHNTAHGIVTVHGRGVHLCHGRDLCRAMALPFAVRLGAALPCVACCHVFCGDVAVRYFVAMHNSVVPRQRNFCRATAHDRVE
jgi:hypothetical protein